jgi:gas vesicle protein
MNHLEEIKAEIAAAQAAIFDPLHALIASAEDDASKYYDKGVKSAGNRLKKKMQEIRKAIKHPVAKAHLTKVQNMAKDARQALTDEISAKANA